jgi:hypothetical protein
MEMKHQVKKKPGVFLYPTPLLILSTPYYKNRRPHG